MVTAKVSALDTVRLVGAWGVVRSINSSVRTDTEATWNEDKKWEIYLSLIFLVHFYSKKYYFRSGKRNVFKGIELVLNKGLKAGKYLSDKFSTCVSPLSELQFPFIGQ